MFSCICFLFLSLFPLSLQRCAVMNVTFSNAVCSNHGGTAVLMYGSNTLVHNITAYGLGCGGIVVEGGDLVRRTSTRHADCLAQRPVSL